MRASCGPNNLVAGRGYKVRPACNSVRAGEAVLREHLTTSGANAKYLSPNIQNEIINICGSLISKKIVCGSS